MARGITENEVHQAADALVEAGERPTVERIRAHLGTGSPNTVTRWLETWWGRLGGRLASRRTTLALPEAPPEVVALASQWWELALSVAATRAKASLAEEHIELATVREQLVAQAQADRDARDEAARQATVQGDRLAAWDQRAADWDAERARMHAETGRLAAVAALDRQALDALRDTHASLQQQFEADRAVTIEYVRSVEDRAHQLVDAGRQEIKALRAAVTTAAREAARKDAALTKERTASARALAVAERETLAARTKAQVTEAALLTFKASLRPQGRKTPTASSPAGRRASPKTPSSSPPRKRTARKRPA